MKNKSDRSNISYRSTSIQKRSKWIYIILPISLFLLAGIIILSLYLTGFFYKRENVGVKVLPPSTDIEEVSAKGKIVPANMLSRSLSLLKDKTGTSPFVVSWYSLAGTISSEKELQSEYLVAEDQVNLLRYYIKIGKKQAAKDLLRAIDENFANESGYLVSSRKVSDLASLSGPQPVFSTHTAYEELPAAPTFSMEATIGYLRALLEYYSKWGQSPDWIQIQRLADLLYSEDAILPEDLSITASTITPFPVGTHPDTDPPDLGQVPTGGTFTTLALASLDLEVFRMLSELDSKYLPLYTNSLEILAGAMVSNDLPLYAVGYTQKDGGYVYFFGDTAQADLISSLKITLHLAEAGQVSPLTIQWIKGQLFNEVILLPSYDLISGQATTTVESNEAYGLVLQIARVMNDADLYSKANARLEWNLATSSTSMARGMIFRKLDSSRIVVYAKDNLETLLGV